MFSPLLSAHAQRPESARFLAGRTTSTDTSAAAALDEARQTHLNLQTTHTVRAQQAQPRLKPLSAAWIPLGPYQVATPRYGLVTGRVTSIAIDPADPTGNTVYLGTTGGGVWKSTNAAGPQASVTFAPLTDTLPVFSANSGTPAIPSLSIGALSVANGVLLAGTGDPNDALDSYYGEGILRATDGGLTWTLIRRSLDGVAGNHSFIGLGVAGFAWSTLSPSLVVAAFSQSAEGALNNAPDTTNSVMGLYYSTDAGLTWQMAVLQDGAQIVQTPLPTGGNLGGNAATAVVWNALRGRFYAAVRYHGYYESVDGTVWTRLAQQPGAGLTPTACPTNPSGTGSPACPIFRGALAVQPVTGDTFALTVDGKNLDQGLWQDTCNSPAPGAACPTADISFGTRLNSTALETSAVNTAIPQGDYNLTLDALPSGTDTILFAGTVDLFRCTLAGGCALRNTTNARNGCGAPAMVAPAQHAIAALANPNTPLVFFGNDGGLWRSIDGVNQGGTPCSPDDVTHFQNLNAGIGSLAEIVSFAQHPTDPNTLLAGLGPNGTAATSVASTTSTPWPQLSPGEGGTVAIDPANPNNWYLSTQAGVSLLACPNGSACTPASFSQAPTIGYPQVANDASLIAPPFLLDPGLTSDVLIGTCRVWRGPAQDGSSWPGSNALSTLLSGPQNPSCSASTNGFLRALAAGGPASGSVAAQNAGSATLYAGLAGRQDGGGTAAGGHIFTTSSGSTASGSTTWTDIARNPVSNDAANAGLFNPGGFDISSVTADRHDATGKTLYATVMGFTGNSISAPHLYGSTDGGVHWLNLSSNLPNAPANKVIVDPNDANTLYVALDTGIYVTTSITTCASANCWSIYGTALPNAPVVDLQAAPAMPTGDGRLGMLRAATYGRGIWSIPLLNAVTPTAAAISLTPTALSFGTQAVSTASSAQTVTVTNSGSIALTITSLSLTSDFAQTNTCTTGPLSPGVSCRVTVQFLPTATGTRTGVLTVYGNVAGGQATVQLSGIGTPPAAIILNPILLTYPASTVGSTSPVQNITVSNTGGTPATLGTAAVTGDFIITANTCGATLAGSTGCTVSVTFKPTAPGTRTGNFTISSSVGTQTAALSGTGTLPATDALSPTTLAFPAQQLNTLSSAQSVTLTNNGDVALQLIAASIAAGDFAIVNACGNSLNAHASCTMQVAFAPKAVGPQTGTLTVSDQYRSQSVTLSGTGVAPPGVSLSPAARLDFGAIGIGSTSAAQTVTLTNNGGLPLAIQSFALTGDFAIPSGANTCGISLAPATACTLQLVFTPSVGGTRTGTLTVNDNAAGSPQTIALTGTGIDFALAPNGPTSFTITAGQQAVYPLLLSSAAGVPGSVTFTCAPIPAHATCDVNPATASLGGTTTIAVTVATSVAGARLHAPFAFPALPGSPETIVFATLLPLGLTAARRRMTAARLRAALGAATLLSLLLIAGCSANRLIPGSGTPPGGGGTGGAAPTPAGTYTLTITATSAGLTRTVDLTLNVQ
ncbi:MAG: hypothetical protein NVSMB62_13290 [Acidobacteriaceae bacterium]